MPRTLLGLPVHPLIVHATVVIVPAAALAVLLAAFWPRARRRLGLGTQALAVLALVLVPLSTASGENLEHSVGESRLIEDHASKAEGLLPWVIGLVVVAALLFVLDRRDRLTGSDTGQRVDDRTREPVLARDSGVATLRVVAAVLAVVASVGTLTQVALIGHSGAKAAWHGTGTSSSSGSGNGSDGDSDH